MRVRGALLLAPFLAACASEPVPLEEAPPPPGSLPSPSPPDASPPPSAVPRADAPPPAGVPPLVDDADFAREMRRSVFVLESLGSSGEVLGVSTAFCVGPRRVMAAWHAVSDAHGARIRTEEGTTWPVKGLLFKWEEDDLAVLGIDAPEDAFRPLALAESDPVPGSRICVVGAPFETGGGCTPSYGTVLGGAIVPTMFRARVACSPGWSGAPVLDGSGKVVGIASRGEGNTLFGTTGKAAVLIDRSSTRSLAVPLERISPRGKFGRQEPPTPGWREQMPPWLKPVFDLVVKGDLDGAAAALDPLLKAHATEPEGWFMLFVVERNRGRNQEGIAALARVRDLRPGEARAWRELGSALAEAGRHEEAVAALRGAVERNPGDRDSLYGLGYSCGYLERWDEAADAFRAVLAIDPTYSAAKEGLDWAESKRAGR